jgi:hypothetical protein
MHASANRPAKRLAPDRDRHPGHRSPLHQVAALFEAHGSARLADTSNTRLLGLSCGAGSSPFGSNS